MYICIISKDSDTEESRRKWYGTKEGRRAFLNVIYVLNVIECINNKDSDTEENRRKWTVPRKAATTRTAIPRKIAANGTALRKAVARLNSH
jgi:hypothetical protein